MVAQREQELARRESEIAAQQSATQEAALGAAQQAAEEYRVRKMQLDEAESLLIDALADLDTHRQAVVTERKQAERDARAERRHIAAVQHAAEIELMQKRETLQRRSEQLDSRQAAMEQMRTELTQLHRETLEMRLAIEETWAQLSGIAPPALVTQTLSRIRSRLADSHRLEIDELAARKDELEAVALKLVEQHEKVAAQKKEVQTWARHEREEFERLAAQLAAREKAVEQDAARIESKQTEWISERRKYQQEIRRLLQQLRQDDPVPALS